LDYHLYIYKNKQYEKVKIHVITGSNGCEF